MASLTTLRDRVIFRAGRKIPTFMYGKLNEMLVDSIRAVQNDVTPDATPNLIYSYTVAIGATTDQISLSGNYHRVLSLVTEESDGEFGMPWIEVSIDRLEEIRRLEGIADATTDTTDTRIFSLAGYTTAPTTLIKLQLYPALASATREYKIKVLYRFSESSTLNLPDYLEELVVDRTLSHIVPDLKSSAVYKERYLNGVMLVNRRYIGRHGLQGAKVGRIRVA